MRFSAILYLKTPRNPYDKISEEDINLEKSQPHFNIPSDMLTFGTLKEAIDALANLASAIKASI